MNNIILTGMPSCGKSTLGRLLAKELNFAFLDTDDVIIERNGCPLKDILDSVGLDGFIRAEEEAVCSIDVESTVIATGGSVVYSPKAMEHLKSLGRIVYISLDYKEVEHRLGDLHERGVAIAPGKTLRDLYDERTPLYNQYANLVVSVQSGNSIRQSINDIKRHL